MHQVRDLVQYWQRRCLGHEFCAPEAEMPMTMPSRVLALCGDHARPSIKLVKGKGMSERYLALRVS
jgi:hypothetical protein